VGTVVFPLFVFGGLMTWLEAARLAGKHWGLEEDITESYNKYRKDGFNSEDSAHYACYEWDVFMSLEIIKKVTEV